MKLIKREPIISYKKSDDILTKLAKIRGIENIDLFFNPDKSVLHDPYLLDNIETAADKIVKALENNYKIGISYDVDVDGISSGAMAYNYLKRFTTNVYNIYAQRSEGHGIEKQLDMIQDDTDLIIIVDSSTNSTEECKMLAEKGIDIVILDHHPFEKANPFALIVNPQCDNYPNKKLSGAGVVLKILQVLDDKLNLNQFDEFYDLAACGIYADVMDVSILENRYIITQGLNNIMNPGLTALLDVMGKNKDINCQTIGFVIAPMINGAARMNKIELAIELLTNDDYYYCLDLAKQIVALNEDRKKIEQYFYDKNISTVDEEDKIAICIDNEIDKGFAGLIANKISKSCYKPAMVLKDGSRLIGSYRSYGDFDLKKFLRSLKFPSIFVEGHAGAGGFGVDKCKLGLFKSIVNNKLRNINFEPVIYYDLELDANEITEDMIKQVMKFDYLTGEGFPQAKFLVKNVFVNDKSFIGKNRDTVKINADNITLLQFKIDPDNYSDVSNFCNMNVVGALNLNEFFNPRYQETIITKQVFIDEYEIVS